MTELASPITEPFTGGILEGSWISRVRQLFLKLNTGFAGCVPVLLTKTTLLALFKHAQPLLRAVHAFPFSNLCATEHSKKQEGKQHPMNVLQI